MKMSKIVYQKEISEPIISFLSDIKESEIIRHRFEVPYTKDQFISFIWSVARHARVNFSYLYNQGLNDAHIETALKKCLSPYKDVSMSVSKEEVIL